VAGDVVYGRQLEQSMSDTCHHCKGDMWHVMTSASDWAGIVAGYVASDVDHLTFDTWKFLVGC
jgi:hypothetical protein